MLTSLPFWVIRSVPLLGTLEMSQVNLSLRISIAAVSHGDPIADLIARIWEAEIDAVRAKKSLVEAIGHLPPYSFLHMELSSHLLNRVFWNQWELQNRLALLDAAAKSLRKINRTMTIKSRFT